MKKILILLFLLIPITLLANVRGTIPISGTYDFSVAGQLDITTVNATSAIELGGINWNTGDIEGLAWEWSSSADIRILPGWCEANGKYYELTSAVTLNIPIVGSTDEVYYWYIDDDVSIAPDISWIVTQNTPITTNIHEGKGLYNGDDRLLGFVINDTRSKGDLTFFYTILRDSKTFEYRFSISSLPNLASSLNPSGLWQDPDDNLLSVFAPVNSVGAVLRGFAEDTTASCAFYCTTAEMAVIETAIDDGLYNEQGFDETAITFEMLLGDSRELKVGGPDDDDSNIFLRVQGYIGRR